ncbi:MAG: outer membrane beta-barrel protein [Chlorobiota bacterium]
MLKSIPITIFSLLIAIPLFAEDYNPYSDNINHFEVGINAGYSIITHEKSIFWDNALNYGLILAYNIDNKNSLELNANFAEIIPLDGNTDIERHYRYRIYPLTFNYYRNIGEVNNVKFFFGGGLSYIYGEYIVDDFLYENNRRNTALRRVFSTNGFGIAPALKVRSPFGDALAIDVLVNYNLIFMESRNSAELSLDHVNAKLGLTYMF